MTIEIRVSLKPSFFIIIVRKSPLHSIISFPHVKLKSNKTVFSRVSKPDRMYHFISNQNIVIYQSSRHKSTLFIRNKTWQDGLQMVGQSLCNNLVNEITKTV
ncbi:hypothetical protein PanWU01x14_179990 [Parasponia andersonii]|uniref:Uncharacterized protein n=1 Tax=Parasponia andersonii TaxID=3476 RepID=A0A2P5C688_PARAD|nr:hypothetical protein PanWU01x14_179990 [Parasponia andersonii]